MAGYPLEAARTVRGAEERRAQDTLAKALRRLDEARADGEAAAARLRELRASAPPAPENGRTSAAEVAREAAFVARLSGRERELTDALAEALGAERAARRAAREARAALSSAAAAAEVIERHRERWTSERERRRERAEEEARDEAARFFRRR